MTTPDTKESGFIPVTFQKDYTFTPENVAAKLSPFITSPEQLPPVDRELLEGKVGVITGSTRGIGAASAMHLAVDYGMKVVVNGREGSRERGERLIQNITERGGEAVLVIADVSTPEGAEELISKAKDRHGRIDAVLHNAGTKDDDLLIRLTPDRWSSVVRTNLDSAFFVTQAAVKSMSRNRDPRGGMIAYVSSVGQEGFPGQAPYAVSKRGMEALADVVAQEYTSRDILTAVYRLGLTDTDLTSDMTVVQKQTLMDALPSHREFKPEEVARAVPFLLTRPESGHILTLA